MTKFDIDPPFWTAVVLCLIKFQKWKEAKAEDRVVKMLGTLENAPDGIDPNSIYHEEPYRVACQISETSSHNLAKVQKQYAEIFAAAEAMPLRRFAEMKKKIEPTLGEVDVSSATDFTDFKKVFQWAQKGAIQASKIKFEDAQIIKVGDLKPLTITMSDGQKVTFTVKTTEPSKPTKLTKKHHV